MKNPKSETPSSSLGPDAHSVRLASLTPDVMDRLTIQTSYNHGNLSPSPLSPAAETVCASPSAPNVAAQPVRATTFTSNAQPVPRTPTSATRNMFAEILGVGSEPKCSMRQAAKTSTPISLEETSPYPITHGVQACLGTTGSSSNAVKKKDFQATPSSVKWTTPISPLSTANNTAPQTLQHSVMRTSPSIPQFAARHLSNQASSPAFKSPMSDTLRFAANPHGAAQRLSASLQPFLPSTPPIKAPPPLFNRPINADEPYSLIHIMMDAFHRDALAKRRAAQPGFDPNIPIAVPSVMIPDFLSFISQHPIAKNSDLEHLLTKHAAAEMVSNELTNNLLTVSVEPVSLKRKREEESGFIDAVNRVSVKPPPKSQRLRKAFSVAAAENKRNALQEDDLQTEANKLDRAAGAAQPPRKRTKRVPQLYDEKGNLTLGKFIEVPMDADEEDSPVPAAGPTGYNPSYSSFKENDPEQSLKGTLAGQSPYIGDEIPDISGQPLEGPFSESQREAQQQEEPETPRASGWRLPNLLASARSVSRFLPFPSRRTPAAVAPAPRVEPPATVESQSERPTHWLMQHEACISEGLAMSAAAGAAARHERSLSTIGAQTEPRLRTTNTQSNSRIDPAIANATGGLAQRRHKAKPKKLLMTKEEVEEYRKLKAEKAVRKEQEELEKQEQLREMQKKRMESNLNRGWQLRNSELREKAEEAQTPGTKRKRLPSPEIIPNPPGGGFGMDVDYFTYNSSDEDDEADQDTPTKGRPNKKARYSSDSGDLVGDPHGARPYTGALFSDPAPSSYNYGTVFADGISAEKCTYQASSPNATPGPSLTFKVPSPTSSDDDTFNGSVDETPSKPAMPKPSNFQAAAQTSPLVSKQIQTRSATLPSSPSKSMAPPPRPNPTHATLPNSSTSTTSDALEKARQKALMHQPSHPSRLRESSRLSTSTVGSDIGDDEKDVAAELEWDPEIEGRHIPRYDPRFPGGMQSPFAATQQVFHKPVTAPPAFAQPATTVKPPSTELAFTQPIATAQPAFTQPVTASQPADTNTVTTAKTTSAAQPAFNKPAIPTLPNIPGLNSQQTVTSLTLEQQFSAFEEWQGSPRVKASIEKSWHDDRQGKFAEEDFEAAFAKWKQKKAFNASSATTTSPPAISSQQNDAPPDAPTVTSRVQSFIDSNWRTRDADDAANDFETQYEAFKKIGKQASIASGVAA